MTETNPIQDNPNQANKVLYREWRPRTFDEVVGQTFVVRALRQAVLNGEPSHAYLFCGTRGTGKTSLAKIFARAINCLNPDDRGNPCNSCEVCTGILNDSLLDVVEMDAASNNSVDNIRKITDEVLFLPTLAKYKVYIIDEVHMLSTAAFNALLKTLEEPPAHVIFILATTDPQRIPATILSRCQRYDFKRIPVDLMQGRLKEIADYHHIEIDDSALHVIINQSEGALRDAISLLDQARSVYPDRPIGREDILSMTGVVNDDLLETVVMALKEGDTDSVLEAIQKLLLEGGDLQAFVTSLSSYYRDLLVCKTARNPASFIMRPQSSLDTMQKLAQVYTQAAIIRQISHLADLQNRMKVSRNPRITLEVGLIEMLNLREIESREKVLASSEPAEVPQAPVPTALAEDKRVEPPQETRPKETPEPKLKVKQEAPPYPEPPSQVDWEPKPEPMPIPEPDSQPEFDAEPEAQPELLLDPRPDRMPQPAPSAAPPQKPIIVAGQTEEAIHEPEPEPAPRKPDLASDVDVDKLWDKFKKALEDQVPLLAILFSSFPRYVEGKTLVIEIPQASSHIYDKIKDEKTRNEMDNIFFEVRPDGDWQLECRLEGQGRGEEVSYRVDEPEWIRKMKEASLKLNIPLEEGPINNNH